MTTQTHSPLPWKCIGNHKAWFIETAPVITPGPVVTLHETEGVCSVYESEHQKANAELICTAVNAHAELMASLEALIQEMEIIECTRCDGTGKRLAHPDEACHACGGAGELVPQHIWPQFLKDARAALLLAKGGAK